MLRTRRGRDRTPDLAGAHFQVAVFWGGERAAERQGMLKAPHPCEPCPGSPCRSPQALASPSTGRSPTEIGRASCREKSVDLGGRRIIKKKKKKKESTR